MGSESSSAWQRLASLRPASAPQTASFSQNSMMPAAPRSGRPPSAPLLAPDDKLARQRRAEQLLQRGKPDEALTDIDALLALEPERAEWLGLRAQALFEKHQFEKDIELEGVPRVVLDAIKKALEVDSEQPRALYTKGMIFKRTGEMKKALICWKRALRADPKNLEAGREFRLAKLRTESQG